MSNHELPSTFSILTGFLRVGGTQPTYPLGYNFLTKNSNVEVLQFIRYLWVDLETIREVNWNDANFTTILLLCGGGNMYVGARKLLKINSLISSATCCSLP